MTGHLLHHVSDCLKRTGWAANRWRPVGDQAVDAQSAETHLTLDDPRMQYHLGRGRRARDAGRPNRGVQEARRALALNPRNPWAFALLGQCLYRSDPARLSEARQALEYAQALDPTNGYFVRLLLEVLYRQHDLTARTELLTQAWWAGAPVDRWLPDGPPLPRTASVLAQADQPTVSSAPERDARRAEARQPSLA